MRTRPAVRPVKPAEADGRPYALSRVLQDFATRDALFPAEEAALAAAAAARRGDVLDIGVGAGRTTGFLHPVARSYRAIDTEPEMVRACQARHPEARVEVGDARRLSGHASGAYDLALFSFNGIDCIAYEDRDLVLREAQRVLRPGGRLLYSSHNLGWLRGRLPGLVWPVFAPTGNPVRLAVRLGRAGVSLVRRLRNRRRYARHERLEADWALVNDDAYDHAMLLVYVDPVREVRRIVEAGFADDVRCFDMNGALTAPSQAAGAWIHFLARKPS